MNSDDFHKIHPFHQGCNDRYLGKTEYDNPYSNDRWEYNAWQHGWDSMDEWLELDKKERIKNYWTERNLNILLLNEKGT